ncbi:hypothetical protein [Bosea beijingensis]
MPKVDLKNVLDDVRARDNALLNMIVHLDRQALALFRIYVTLAVALAAVAGSYSVSARIDVWTAVGAAAAALVLAIGCFFCMQTVRSAKVGVPGKGADFWMWALRDDVSEEALLTAYLNYSDEAQKQNYRVNDHSTRCLKIAKRLGVASIIVGGAIALSGATGVTSLTWSWVKANLW